LQKGLFSKLARFDDRTPNQTLGDRRATNFAQWLLKNWYVCWNS